MLKKLAGAALSAFLIVGPAACKKDTTGPGDTVDLVGRVLSSGQPVAGLNVYLSWGASQVTQTDGAGTYQFSDLTAGNYIITPSRQGWGFNPSNYSVGSATEINLNFQVQQPVFGSTLGDIAANFSLINQSGQLVSLYDYFGKVILLDFSADWCEPCQAEATQLQSLYNELKDKGFVVITLLGVGQPAGWAQTYSLTFPVVDDTALGQWGIYGEGAIPLNVVLDRNGTIRYKVSGYSPADVKDAIKKYL